MSGMFQRIARRNADRPDEPSSDPATEAASEAPDAATAPAGDGQATADLAADDRPTERIATVTPAPSIDQPTGPQTPVPLSEQPAAVTTAAVPASSADPGATPTVVAEPAARRPGFRARGRMRRRLRYLRRLRELQVRDLGGLVFDLRRFERRRDDLVAHKIDQIRACDDELHALELALAERRDLRDVREPGIGGTCPRCFAVFGSADKFCANCGAAFGGAVQGPAAQVPLTPSPAPAAQPVSTAPPSPPAQPEASAPDR
jgi:hypothetical protein